MTHRPIALLLLAVALNAGCGDTAPDTPAEETAHPLKIVHALGLTLVPGRAKRPVVLHPGELDDVLALGITPVGAATPAPGVGFPRYLGHRVRGIASVGSVRRPDMARIERLDPDLILGSTPSHRKIYRSLRRIAPAVIADERVHWQPNLRQDGEALGRTDAAEAMLSAYDTRVGRLRRSLPRFPSAAAVARALPARVRPFLARPFISSIMKDARLPHPRPRRMERFSARPGPGDQWSLGVGVIAANRVLDDLARFLARG